MEIDKTIKILFVAPYESLGNIFRKQIAKFPQFSTDVVIGDLEDGVIQTEKRIEQEEYDLIISRGGTSELIKTITEKPVIQVPITTSDVLMALKLTERYTEKYAVVGFPSITKYALEIKELLQKDYEIITLNHVDQVENTIRELKEQGISMILGDVITHNIARSLGINSVLILSSEESIKIAINQAILMSETLIKVNEKVSVLKSILERRSASYIIYSSDGVIIEKSLSLDIDESKVLSYLDENLPKFLSGDTKYSSHRIGLTLLGFQAKQVQTALAEYTIVSIFVNDWIETSRNQGVQLIRENINGPVSFYNTSTSLGKVRDLLNNYRDVSNVIVLIGEDGTGKVAAARALHQLSVHRDKPFYLIDCYHYQPDTLQLDSAQFDFSDSRGTSVVFDNFQDASSSTKKHILDFIDQSLKKGENRFYITLSSSVSESKDCYELQSEVDLISKAIPSLTIEMPPLRERKEDLPNLITLYLGEFRESHSRQVTGFKNEALEKLVQYDWPGNMTQLKRVVEELGLQASSYYISERQVKEILEKENRLYMINNGTLAYSEINMNQTLNEITKDVVEFVLEQENMNQTKAAERLGIGRSTIWRILKSEN